MSLVCRLYQLVMNCAMWHVFMDQTRFQFQIVRWFVIWITSIVIKWNLQTLMRSLCVPLFCTTKTLFPFLSAQTNWYIILLVRELLTWWSFPWKYRIDNHNLIWNELLWISHSNLWDLFYDRSQIMMTSCVPPIFLSFDFDIVKTFSDCLVGLVY